MGIYLLGFFVLMAIFAPLIAPYSPQDGSFAPLLSPSREHLMGDHLPGLRHLLPVRLRHPALVLVGIFGGLFATVIAVFVGMISGYSEGTFLDNFLSFFTNLALVVPVLPLMMVIMAYSEVRGLWLMVFVIGITSWAGAARGKRAQIITLRSRDFVTAAKFSGERSLPIVFKEIMPNMTSLVVSGFIAAATGAIVAEAGLSFLGFGDPTAVTGVRCWPSPTPTAPWSRASGLAAGAGPGAGPADHLTDVHQLRRRPAEQSAPPGRLDDEHQSRSPYW